MICSRKDLRRLRMSINKGQNSSQYSKCHPVSTLIRRMDGHAGGWGMHELRHCITPCHFSLEIRAFRRAPPMSRSPSLKRRRQINSLARSVMAHPPTLPYYPHSDERKAMNLSGRSIRCEDLTSHIPESCLLQARNLRCREVRGLASPRLTEPMAADLEHHFHLKVQSQCHSHLHDIAVMRSQGGRWF